MRAAIVVTGDEVLHGRVAESNGAFLARWLEAHGVIPERITVVPDDAAVIRDLVLSHVEDGVDLVITSGGLGGTHDDVTMAAVGEAAGRARKPQNFRSLRPQKFLQTFFAIESLRC